MAGLREKAIAWITTLAGCIVYYALSANNASILCSLVCGLVHGLMGIEIGMGMVNPVCSN